MKFENNGPTDKTRVAKFGIFAIMLTFLTSFGFSSFLLGTTDSQTPNFSEQQIPQQQDLYISFPVRKDENLPAISTFLPGTLSLPRLEVINKCYVDTKKYGAHRTGNMCTYSEEFNLFYLLLPKSGSSTGRHVMKHDFAAREYLTNICRKHLKNEKTFGDGKKLPMNTISLRNPISRFYASYDEMFVRKLPYIDKIPEKYRSFMNHFRGWVYQNYSALFYDDDGVNLLTDTFEQFVHDYDGRKPFDEHLKLQMPSIVNHDGFPYRFDYVIDTKKMDEAFVEIAELVGNSKDVRVIRGRSYPRRFNTSRLSTETMRKICELSLIDFCCLNYPLPDECVKYAPNEKVARPMCKWVEKVDPSTGETKQVITEHMGTIAE
eukprot:maker-scaffold_11-snap-gene-7.5-mRNA-1 protein AED:0.05 eAED:0.05 QI:289/1/1/1/0.4/0.16/6/641/375